MRPPKTPPTPEQLFQKAESLCRNVENLEAAVMRLAGRIQAFEGEQQPRVLRVKVSDGKPVTMDAVYRALLIIDKKLDYVVRDMGATKAHIDQIENDSWSRDDLKHWIVPEKRERKPVTGGKPLKS
jgi:hypothetical protein